jgi:hypothetical protein
MTDTLTMPAASSTAASSSSFHLRFELEQLRARYDSGAVSPPVYKVIREIETELAWSEHRRARIR